MRFSLKKAALFAAILPFIFAGAGKASAASATIQSVSGSGSASATFFGNAQSTSSFSLPTASHACATSFRAPGDTFHYVSTTSGIWVSNQVPSNLYFHDYLPSLPPSIPLGSPLTGFSCMLLTESPPLSISDGGTASGQQSVSVSFVIDTASQWQLFMTGQFISQLSAEDFTYHLTGPGLDVTYTKPTQYLLTPVNLLPGTYTLTGSASAAYTINTSVNNFNELDFSLQLIPEPTSLALLAAGMLALAGRRTKRH